MTPEDLRRFTGTENYYQQSFNRKIMYTDGVKYFVEHAGQGAYWFLDILISEREILEQASDFACIKLEVDNFKQATISVTDGDYSPPVFTRKIHYTDCPEGIWEFYFTNNVILLPSEY